MPTLITSLDITRAVDHLRSGGLLVYPTETSYAIGCDATNARAVRAVCRAKKRDRSKSLPVIVASRAMAKRWGRWNAVAERETKIAWPGPTTIVLHRRSSSGTIALRISSHPIATALTRHLKHPIISTSANLSGDPPCFSIPAAQRSFGTTSNVMYLDAGTLPKRKPSTILDCTQDPPSVMR